MKFVKLLTAAYVAGVLRHPHEGAIPVADAEAKRLVDSQVAEDATDGFSGEQIDEAQAEPITINAGGITSTPAENPHQAEVETDKPTKPQGRKAAAAKE
jgi:hypothetical protein